MPWPESWGERTLYFVYYAFIATAFALAVYAVVQLSKKEDTTEAGVTSGVSWAGRAVASRVPYAFNGNAAVFREASNGKTVVRIMGRIAFVSDDPASREWARLRAQQLLSVTYYKDRFVAVDTSNVPLQSADGVTWGAIPGAPWGVDVATDGKTLLFAYGTHTYATTDLETWTRVAVSDVSNTSMMYDTVGGVFLVGTSQGGVYSSADGAAWTEVTAPNADTIINICRADDAIFVSTGNNLVRYRADGATEWTVMPAFAEHIYHVARHGDVWCFAGTQRLYVSYDAGVTIGNTRTYLRIDACARNATVCVAVGTCGILSGASWGALQSRAAPEQYFHAVVWNADNALFIAFGTAGTIVTSPDGVTWTAQTSNVTVPLLSAIVDGATTIACGEGGKIVSSTDGVTWTQQHTGGANLVALALDASVTNRYVCVGEGGTVLTATAADAWTAQTSLAYDYLIGVASNGAGLYIIVSQDGVVLHSTDGGVTWTAPDTDMPRAPDLWWISFVEDHFWTTSANGEAWTSTDGLAWARVGSYPMPSGEDYAAPVGYDAVDGLYLVACSGTSLFSSTDARNWAVERHDQLSRALALYDTDRWVLYLDSGSLESADAIAWAKPLGALDVACVGQNANVLLQVNTRQGTIYTCADGSTLVPLEQGGWSVGARAVLVATDEVWVIATPRALYRTTDSGATWTQVESAPVGASFTQADQTDATLVVGTSIGVLYRSDDQGKTWTTTVSGLLNTSAVCAATGVWTTSDGQQLARSIDDGKTWTPVPMPFVVLTLARTPDGLPLAGVYIQNLGLCLYASADSGDTWTLWGCARSAGTSFSIASLSDGVAVTVQQGDGSNTTFTTDGQAYESLAVDLPVAHITNFQGKTQLHGLSGGVVVF